MGRSWCGKAAVIPVAVVLLTVSTHESVSNAGDGENQLRFLGVVFQLLPQTGDVSVDGSGKSIRVIAPYRTEEFFSWHCGTHPLHQVAKKLEFTGCEID